MPADRLHVVDAGGGGGPCGGVRRIEGPVRLHRACAAAEHARRQADLVRGRARVRARFRARVRARARATATASDRARGRARIRVRVRVRVEVRVEVRVRAARPTPMLARRLWPRRRWSEAERSPRTSEGDVARCREMWGDVGEI